MCCLQEACPGWHLVTESHKQTGESQWRKWPTAKACITVTGTLATTSALLEQNVHESCPEPSRNGSAFSRPSLASGRDRHIEKPKLPGKKQVLLATHLLLLNKINYSKSSLNNDKNQCLHKLNIPNLKI